MKEYVAPKCECLRLQDKDVLLSSFPDDEKPFAGAFETEKIDKVDLLGDLGVDLFGG